MVTDEERKLAREYVNKKYEKKSSAYMNASNDKQRMRMIADGSVLGKEDLDYKILDGTADESAIKQYAMYRQNQIMKTDAEIKAKNEKNSVEAWRRGEAKVVAVMGDTYNEVDPAYMGGVNTNVQLPEKLEPDNTAPNIINVSNDSTENSLYEEYGNNYFELITYDNIFKSKNNSAGALTLAGVLKDIPSFSMTAEWEKGPAASVSDAVKNFMFSPGMEMMTTLGGHDRTWMNLDEGTDRTYKTVDRPSFELSFKLYTNENIGSKSLTTYQTWLKALSLYAMPSIDAKVSINAMANNVLNGVYGCVDLADKMIDAAKTTFNASSQNDDKDIIDNIADTAVGVVNAAAETIQSRNGEWRVTSNNNLKNYYGAKLWYLKILPGIFRKPLIVYIQSWGITYSKEVNPNTGRPIWVEFKINCQMDQIASAPIWMKYLRNTTDPSNYDTYYEKTITD
jgi:hypothetical protein